MSRIFPLIWAPLPLAFFAALAVPIRSAWGDIDDRAVPEYAEPLRPQFHFTARQNWLNDPNGLVLFQGEYHQFFQYNPLGLDGGDFKAWGHAVSPDLVHWRQLNIALTPDKLGSIWSGSAVVDWQNTSGFQMGAAPPLVVIYTTAGGKVAESKGQPFTQSVAYSNDRGRTWTKYSRNPVVKNISSENRDPKVIWHAQSKHWVMALYLADDRFAILTSPDLKEWKKIDEIRIAGSSECPDFFPAPIENQADATKWIFWSASGTYLIGNFDGNKFVDESGPLRDVVGANYAAQTFSDIPASDGRRVQIAWMRDGRYPGMPFNQQMSFPVVVALRLFPEGLRLIQSPVKELSLLHDRRYAWSGELDASTDPLADLVVDACEIRTTIDPADASTIAFTIRGLRLTYDTVTQRLSTPGFDCAIPITDGKLRLVILVDRTSIEVFAQDGRVMLSECFVPPADERRATLSGAGAKVESLECWTLKSSWRSADE